MMTRRQKYLALIAATCDAVAVGASFFFAYHMRFFSGIIPVQDRPELLDYSSALAVVLAVYLWFFRAYGLYDVQRRVRRIEEIFTVIKAVSFAALVLMAVTFIYRDFSYSRIYLLTLWITSIVFVSFSRYLLIQWEYRRKIRREELTRVLLIGANRNARNIIRWAKNNRHYGHEIAGVLTRSEELVGKHIEGITITGTSSEVESHLKKLNANLVILLDPAMSRSEITDLVALCEDRMIEFKLAADFYGLMTRHVDVEYISSIPLLGFRDLPLDDPWNRAAKRIFDLVATSILILASLPFWLLAILLIKLADRGPIVYKQSRLGRDQVVFDLLKFRTMKVDAEKETGPVWARPNDSRRTWVGNFLRRWNIDELPQFLNVLRGEMSLVGPRPERPHFVNQFKGSITRYMARHKVKAGITGWAQVNGYRGSTSLQQRINYDLYYMENWSILFDLEILFMTLFAYKNAY